MVAPTPPTPDNTCRRLTRFIFRTLARVPARIITRSATMLHRDVFAKPGPEMGQGLPSSPPPPPQISVRSIPDSGHAHDGPEHSRSGRVRDGRGSLGPSASAPFPISAHRTGRADLPHHM